MVVSPADGAIGEDPRPSIAYVSYSSGEFDARTIRMARSALAAGYRVTVYARWYPGLPLTEERDGYRIIRPPFEWRLAVPGLRGAARRRLVARMRSGVPPVPVKGDPSASVTPDATAPATPPRRRTLRRRILGRVRRAARRAVGVLLRPARGPYRHWRRVLYNFPGKPLYWGAALVVVAEPHELWHGMWAGSLPGITGLKRRYGGRSIYDSRDVFMQSRDYATAGRPAKPILEWLERHWARDADLVLTVNEAYADLLTKQLGVPRPRIVMNCPVRWEPPTPRPDRFRERLGIGADTAIVLYQGGLMTNRGIEQSMVAILDVPGAVLCLLGHGALRDALARQVTEPPFAGRVHLLDSVPPDELLAWTASADVSVMAIQPSSVNHRYTTPQKLFESLAAGVPIVASDLPGMAEIVSATRTGILCDPTDPAAIAAAIRALLESPPEERDALRGRALAAAHERYNWEIQVETLFAVYRELLAP